MSRTPLLAALLIAGCHSFGAPPLPGGVSRIDLVRTEDRPGVDVDAAAELGTALRRRLLAVRTEALASASEGSDGELVVEVIDVKTALAPLSDPSRRAGEYRADLTISGRLLRRDGHVAWSSAPVVGSANYYSVPGGIESLDGQRRAALARAADDAARQLIDALYYAP
jgi:hypothetical protein